MLVPRVHKSKNHLEMYGCQLEVGDFIQGGDVYRTDDGYWKKCGYYFVGKPVAKGYPLIIRRLPVATFPPRQISVSQRRVNMKVVTPCRHNHRSPEVLMVG
jgi:hypothetical protein